MKMKTTNVFFLAVIIFFGVALTDGNTKTLNGNNEGPRRRVVLVSRHCYVRPIVRYERRERHEYREYRRHKEHNEHRERDRR